MRLKLFVSFLFFVFTLNFVVEALEQKDQGVCEVNISERKTRTKLVTINKKCGKKKCVVKKTETYTQPQKRLLCCKGWGYDTNLDKCTPICSTGCEGGKCVAPETCTCDPPSYIDSERRNVCVQPNCDPPCVNGKCVANNTCQCEPNFYIHNSTHCFNCGEGYQMVGSTCEPTCDQDCGPNGYCSAPNLCSCKEGYQLNNATCKPSCDCINATCKAPNICECLEGYKKFNESVCVPECENCTGKCIAPQICQQCEEGYTYADGECKLMKTKCEVLCVNGHCQESNVCTCDPGYVKNGSDPTICVRSCHQPRFEEKSEQATKSTKFSKRSRKTCPPKTTECTPEQEKELEGFNRNIHICCAKPNGPIKTRNFTICCDGWVYENDTCKPICRRGCHGGGYCASPGVCNCDPPLIRIDEITCALPTCDPPCVNGKCVNNNECSCDPNHNMYNATHCAPKCDPGLFLEKESLTCKSPSCEPPCENGRCIEPNVCVCNEGYSKENGTNCRPTCDPDCLNGICISPNTCSCKIGYEIVNATYCKPICDECGNGECVAPNLCECKEGYSLKDGSKCTPVCNKKCVNATCESPDKCVCLPGYEPTEDDAVCRPKCYACEHGDCVAPLNCQCHDGYARGVGGCLPVCPEPCVNGKCTEPNICTCHEGYQKNSTHASVCFKPCNGPCEFGKCNFHGECLCDRGYAPQNGTCFALTAVDCASCKHNCTYGECYCSDNRPCNLDVSIEEGLTSAGPGLAGLELTWILCGAALLLLVILVVVMQGIWRRRKRIEKEAGQCQGNTQSSVMFTMSNTPMINTTRITEDIDEEAIDALDDHSAKTANEELLNSESSQQTQEFVL